MRVLSGLCLVLFTLLLAGCGDAGDFADLKAFMAEVKAKPPGNIEPIPRFAPYQAFAYEASALRSPFQPPVKVDLVHREKGSKLLKPDPNRVKQFLEGFNIEQFEMVGTLSNDSGSFALISGAGGVHRVKVGDYLGRNDGKIISISDSQIDVVEIVPDGEGGWLERPRSISLKERS
jgi:type IV pilus assembly protein PilP